jgi:hypothetical protein
MKIYLIARVERLTAFVPIVEVNLQLDTCADVCDAMAITQLLIVQHLMPSCRIQQDAVAVDSDIHQICIALACDAMPAIRKQTALQLQDLNVAWRLVRSVHVSWPCHQTLNLSLLITVVQWSLRVPIAKPAHGLRNALIAADKAASMSPI